MSADHNGDAALPLDGNAAAGLLRELFAFDVTEATVTCAGCGTVAEIGAIRVYGGTMGAIFRCAHCDTAMIRLTRTKAGYWLDMHGARTLFARAPQR